MGRRQRVPTMKDVARLAGVSIQTVSCVVNRKGSVTAETRDRVQAAIKQLDYRPFSVARSLRTHKTHTIAFFVPDIANPSLAAMASAAEEHAYAHGYNLVLYNTHEDSEREDRYVLTATQSWVDGVVFVSVQDFVNSLETLQAAGIPSVAVDRIPENYDGPSVTLDNVQAGRLAAEHLTDLDHTRLAHISGPSRLWLSQERQRGFQETLAARGLEQAFCVASEGEWDCQTGFRAMQRILAHHPHPTAVFAANDRIAIGAMQAAYQAGLRVPEDCSVMGLDDIEVAAFQIPPLTTIRQSFAQLGSLGVQQLLNRLAGKEPAQTQVVLEPTLVVRQSTAPPPK